MEILSTMALILSNLHHYIFLVTYYDNVNVNISYVSRWRNRLDEIATIKFYNSPKIYFYSFMN